MAWGQVSVDGGGSPAWISVEESALDSVFGARFGFSGALRVSAGSEVVADSGVPVGAIAGVGVGKAVGVGAGDGVIVAMGIEVRVSVVWLAPAHPACTNVSIASISSNCMSLRLILMLLIPGDAYRSKRPLVTLSTQLNGVTVRVLDVGVEHTVAVLAHVHHLGTVGARLRNCRRMVFPPDREAEVL